MRALLIGFFISGLVVLTLAIMLSHETPRSLIRDDIMVPAIYPDPSRSFQRRTHPPTQPALSLSRRFFYCNPALPSQGRSWWGGLGWQFLRIQRHHPRRREHGAKSLSDSFVGNNQHVTFGVGI